MKRCHFNRMCKRLRRCSYNVPNAILIGRKAVIYARTDYDMDLVQSRRIIGRISDYFTDESTALFIVVENCEYSYSLNGTHIHQSGIRHADKMAVDKDTILHIDYVIEKC